ncbi:MAG: glycosyltransferase family 4 protein [bacterium]
MKVEPEKRIVLLTQHFYPEITSTGQLLTELAEELKNNGFSILTITRKHQKDKVQEQYKGIQIGRIRGTRFSKANIMGRLINDFTFFWGAFFCLLQLKGSDILFIVSNPPFLPFLGWLIKKLKKNRFVYLVHDIYPDIAVNLGVIKANGIIQRIWDYFNQLILTEASVTVVLGDCMQKVVSRKIKPGNGTFATIPNWCDGELVKPMNKLGDQFAVAHGLDKKYVVFYSGNLGLFQYLEAIIYAAEALADYQDILFLFVGEGGKKAKLEKMVKEKGLSNVKFLPYQDKSVMSHSYAAADVDIITLEKGAEGLGVPSKLYTIMASGRPIIALLGKDSEVSRVIAAAGCGYVLDQDNIEEFKNKILHLYHDRQLGRTMGEKARGYFEKHFAKNIIINEYVFLFKQLFQKAQPI